MPVDITILTDQKPQYLKLEQGNEVSGATRAFRLSLNPPSFSSQRESGTHLDPYSPSFSSQRESRALFPIQPGLDLQQCSSLDVNLSARRVLVGIIVLVHYQGSGLPLRR